MINCKYCGRDIPGDAVYCCYCGKKQIARTAHTRKRGNGTGSVYKGVNGYTAELTLGYSIDDGKRKRHFKRKKGFTTKKAALEWLATYEQKPITKKITFSELFDIFQTSTFTTLSGSKQCAYRIAWNKIKNVLGYRRIDDLTVVELQDITDTAAASYYTARDIKTLLSHLYKIAIREDIIDKNKTEFIQLPPRKSKTRDCFTSAEIAALWDCWKNEKRRICGAILIMLYTGMRTGELRSVRTENVHLQDHYLIGGIKTEKSKNNKIIIPDKIAPVIENFLQTSVRGLLCYYHDDKFYDEFNVMRDELQLNPNLTPYCARHTYVTTLTRLNLSPAMLSELVGHTDYETTLNYTHLSIDDRLRAVNKIDY